MRVVLLLAAVTTLYAVGAAAQADEIALYADAGYSRCELVDSSPGPVYVYVVHHPSGGGGNASQFQVRMDAGVSLSYLSESSQFALSIGDTQTGVSYSYGECFYSDVLVTTITYFGSGTSSACSYLQVTPDPKSLDGTILVTKCDYQVEAIGSRLVINADGSCACGPTTEYTSWGQIKAGFEDN